MTTVAWPSIVHVLWSGNVGGIERLTTDLAAEQVRQGMRVGVAFGRAAGPFVESVQAAGAEVVDLGFANGYDLRPRRLSRVALRLAWANVIHLHGYNPAFEMLCRRASRPIVFTEHGNFGQGRALGLDHRVKERLKSRFLKETVDVVAANSAYTADRLKDLYGLAESSVYVVHNGIPIASPEHDLAHPARGDSVRVAFVGRLAGVKRIDRLIDAVSRMPLPRRVGVTIAGRGPLEGDLRERAAALGVEGNVAFVGLCADVPGLLASSDVVVLPSAGEAFGLTIVEGSAVGAFPIIFADGGGALEVIPPDGIVVRDVDELALALERLRGSVALSTDARRARAAWAREHFPISRTCERYLDLYRMALENRRA